ncbi:hypothetical protein F2Q70_00024143 [Brassica cretica]|uniref:Uncharacterized protein n=2 Tax=Brassica cretica TaxID=69181 RepID=A0A8S9HRS6_BRACR|nr:hypothetical protein F2Q70_00024143 [Brassica cretica]KAF2559980.1 hypothetical protein F2Q68_00018472 [Brassica cretica]KAF3609487.1 hypothetical protein DY000_02051690 [Brassica cretica]
MEEFSPTVSCSPSFSFYASSECADAAAKVSRENQSYNITEQYSVKVNSVDDFQFETSSPLHEETFVHFPTFKPVSSDTVSMIRKKSESEELNKFSGNCLWSPLRSPATGGGHSKVSKRCRLTKFLTRSHSDATKTCLPDMKRKDKSASKGDKRRKSYLPYRQDLIGVFAGMRRLRH